MNKIELVEAIASKTKSTKKDVQNVVDAFMETVKDTVQSGSSVTLVGFGTFASKQRNARTGRNPQTGEPIQIEAKTVPSFKAGKKFKETVAEAG